ncbi:hypothetical protein F5Y04DRAFT_292176 [Hypomontagnella monticulosa]|nr:hypothetical protein F5Y04DRAFT_292176 [Hypomontagnella monticulosa]
MEEPNDSQLGVISLMPETSYRLNDRDQVYKHHFKEMFTWNSHGSTVGNGNYAQPTIQDLHSPLPWIQSPTPPLRVLYTPGRAPFPRGIPDHLSYRIPSQSSMTSFQLQFEDTCRMSKHHNMLNAIKAASFVTDAPTLAALFETLYHFLMKDHCDFYGAEGITLAVQSIEEHGTIFLKALGPYGLEPEIQEAADKRMESVGLNWSVKAGEGSIELDSFKRVVSYGLGELDMVVEVGNNVSMTDHMTKAVENMKLQGKDDVAKRSDGQ